MPVTFWEKVDSVSPGNARFGMGEGGQATVTIDVLPQDLTAWVNEILGWVIPKSDGRLARLPPVAHPFYHWLYAERVSDIRGLGKAAKGAPASAPGVGPIALGTRFVGDSAYYDRYRLTIEFTPRPYSIVPDEQITVVQSKYYDENNAETPFRATTEYDRWTDWQTDDNPDYLTAQQGQMIFRRGDGFEDPAVGPLPLPHLYTFAGLPKLVVPRANIIFRWYMVPESYLRSRNSFLRRFQGLINQYDWMDWRKGELLYVSYRQRRYTPPVPDFLPLPNNQFIFSIAKYVDLELIFQETKRTTPSAPTPLHKNYIAAGHNLLPWFGDRKYYYATAVPRAPNQSNQLLWTPSYLSVPFELLFTDPDVNPVIPP